MVYRFNAAIFPDAPGVYIMKDERGVLYVGKAISLKKRVGQYFQDLSTRQNINVQRISALVESIRDIEIITTNNEREALLLENELIKKYQPPFNIRLKDDKSFPYIMITCEEEFPRVLIIRGVEQYSSSNLFFGPYTDKGSVIKILKHVRYIFPYCSCQQPIPVKPKKPKRPCLYYHMKTCPAPCAFQDEGEMKAGYRKNIKNLILFLQGNYHDLQDSLKREMEDASSNLEFERAATIRDKIHALEKMFKPQAVISLNHEDVDTVTFVKNEYEMLVLVMEVRTGRLIGKIPFIYDVTSNFNSDGEIIETFLVDYYSNNKKTFPEKIILEITLDDPGPVQDIIRKNSGERNCILESLEDQPGLEDLVKIGKKNAIYLLHKRAMNRELASFDHQDALKELAVELDLDHPPIIIEGYDISNISGKDATGSKVCFKDGKPYKNQYRRYRIRSGDTPDDFRMMAEIIRRRFTRVVEGRDVPPDLIVIDGGPGQLGAAMEQLEVLGLEHLSIIGLAKKEEEIYVPEHPGEPLRLAKDSKALLLLQRVRDESHRFALKYHHTLHGKTINETEKMLLEIESIGSARARILLDRFKTVVAIKEAPVEELEIVLGSKKVALAVYKHFHKGENKQGGD